MRIDRKKLMIVMFDNGITQKELAERTNLSRATVNSIRSGKSCSDETAHKIANALKVSLDEILE